MTERRKIARPYHPCIDRMGLHCAVWPGDRCILGWVSCREAPLLKTVGILDELFFNTIILAQPRQLEATIMAMSSFNVGGMQDSYLVKT